MNNETILTPAQEEHTRASTNPPRAPDPNKKFKKNNETESESETVPVLPLKLARREEFQESLFVAWVFFVMF